MPRRTVKSRKPPGRRPHRKPAKAKSPTRSKPAGPVFESIRAFAAAVGRGEATLRRWLDLDDCPVANAGPWAQKDVDVLKAWAAVRFAPKTRDPLLYGVTTETSPALERYRAARARLAELDVATQEGQLLDRAVVHEWLSRLSAILRNVGESLGRKFGADALALHSDGLDEFDRQVLTFLGESGRQEVADDRRL